MFTFTSSRRNYTLFFVDHHERANGRQYNNCVCKKCVYCTSNNWVNNKIILWNHREFSESLDDVMEFVEEKLVVIKSNNNNFAYIAYLCVFSCTVPLCNKQMCVSFSPYSRTGIPKSHVSICMSFECKLTKVWMKMLSKLKVTKVSQNLVCSN